MPTAQAIPPEAARVVAGLALAPAAPDAETIPLTLTARSAEPVNHWLWGPLVHDFAGMKTHKQRLPVDYCHDYGEVIGYAESWTAGDALTAEGVLIAQHPRVAELRRAVAAGVPFEASIAFEPETLVIEEVPAGQTGEANGRSYPGPITIFRKWNLRGVAICPYGYDRETAAQFQFAQRNHTHHGDPTMATHTAPPAETETDEQATAPEQTTDTPASNGKPSEPDQQTPPDQSTQGDPPAADDQAAPPESPAPADAAGKADAGELTNQEPAQTEGQRFLAAFGQQGAVWFAEGKTFEQARDLHVEKLTAENAELRQRLAAAGDAAGDPEPTGFSAAPDGQPSEPTSPEEKRLTQNLGSRLGAFASSLKLNRKS